MIWLITGGAGFIGYNFIEYIMEKYKEDKIVCIDKLNYAGRYNNIEKLKENKRFQFVKVDICNKLKLNSIFESNQFDCVVNFAAESHVDRSICSAEPFIKSNVMGTQILLDAANRFQIPRFHQISTDEVYGDIPLKHLNIRFDEKCNLRPSNPYSASKASADLLVLSYYRTYELPITISRSSNNYGAHQHPEKLIPLMICNAYKNKPLPIYGDGMNIRNWLHVKDHCRAVDMIVRKGNIGEIYNVGSDYEQRNINMVKIILDTMKKPYNLIHFVEDRPGHDKKYSIDTTKIKDSLGWKPEISFQSGIEATIQWYLSQYENEVRGNDKV